MQIDRRTVGQRCPIFARNRVTTGAFLNYSNYSNPRVDEIAAALRETVEPAPRMALIKEVQEEIR